MKKRVHDLSAGLGRVLTVLLAAVLLTGLLPLRGQVEASAASWVDPYIEQVRGWGIMAGDSAGNLHPERKITRAEFVTMMNRAFGYTKQGKNPFSDVPEGTWYKDDICIAYHAGYFAGTSSTTASPHSPVTREQAVTMLGRCIRIRGKDNLDERFNDSKKINLWARSLVQGATDMGIIAGYPDGGFHPQTAITRGETASILVRAMGTLVKEPGTHSLGNVFGNLTINTQGVVLKNTTITGNLYLTGGVDLESLVLENVNVMGRIVICGAGSSQKGKSSVVLRNVKAGALEVDSLQNRFISVRTEGLTNIPVTTVRTSAYVEDMTGPNLGLKLIQMEGDRKPELQLAGNIKEVINRAPDSKLVIAQGAAKKVTMDEKATNSTLRVDRYASIEETNLDLPVKVSGAGSLGHLNVNAPDCEVEMLPDTITVRPGITANINKEVMDSVAAAESSEEPRILSGYPQSRNVAPNGADAVFSTNKRGTVRWALTAMTDGSVGEEELLNPASHTNKIIKSGTLDAKTSRSELSAKISGLTRDGSYYISAMLTDNRGHHSQVKIAAFTTPDDSIPEFAPGYPEAIMAVDADGKTVVQAKVMANKTCRLYYALMPKGASAPRPEDFKAGAVSGNLGWGQMDLRKNTPSLLAKVNSINLKEQENYDLYLWLTDVDNGKSSAVRRLTITTPDRTPPKLQHLTRKDAKATSVTMAFAVDEPGTFYWAVVKKGQRFFTPTPENPTPESDKNNVANKIQIENGVGALKKGSVNVSRALEDITFNITGLEAQTAYDLYYVVKDRAGNYNVYTQSLTPPMEIKTLDNQPPTVKQEFTHDGGTADVPSPYPDTSIRLAFSEPVQGISDENGTMTTENFLELYQKGDRNKLADALRKHIRFYRVPISGIPVAPDDRNANNEQQPDLDWIVDFRKAKVDMDITTGEMIITLPYSKKAEESGLNLASGATYYIELEGIADTAPNPNYMVGERGVVKLPKFTTIDAQIFITPSTSKKVQVDGDEVIFDIAFKATPLTADSVEDEVVWDLLLWSGSTMKFKVYQKDAGGDWVQVKANNAEEIAFNPTKHPEIALSLSQKLLTSATDQNDPKFEQLNKMPDEREYGIVFTELNGETNRKVWSGKINIGVMPVAKDRSSMTALVTQPVLNRKEYQDFQAGIMPVKEIGVPKEQIFSASFQDTTPPTFRDGYPFFTPGDTAGSVDVMLSRGNTTCYYVIAPLGKIPTTLMKDEAHADQDVRIVDEQSWAQLPENGETFKNGGGGNLRAPVSGDITNARFNSKEIISGNRSMSGSAETIEIPVGSLQPSTNYIAYFVLQGESPDSVSPRVYGFRFKTEAVVRPILSVSIMNPKAIVRSEGQKEADVRYLMMVRGNEIPELKAPMEWDPGATGRLQLTPALEQEYKKMTILEAMQRSHNNLGSVFDLCATVDSQNRIANILRSAQAGPNTSIVAVGDLTLNQNNRPTPYQDVVNCEPNMLKGGEEYWFVAVGQTLGSGYAFAANGFLYKPETAHPMVTSLRTSYDLSAGGDLHKEFNEAAKEPYSGEIVITFSENLYFKDESKKLYQVVDGTTLPLGGDYYLSSLLLTNTGAGSKITIQPQKGDADKDPVTSLVLKYNNITGNGATFTFKKGICTQRGNEAEALAITMKLVKNAEGYYEPTFVVGTPSWDATPKN